MTHHGSHSAALSPSAAHGVAQGLGWFSIALGLMELLAPRELTRALGMRGSEGLVQAYGLRELASGIGILASKDPTPWVWSRVAGDGLDLATLANGMQETNLKRDNVGLAMAAVAGVTVVDLLCAQALSKHRQAAAGKRPDYSDRVGMPRPASSMRGAARDFETPRDMRAPEALRPWTTAA